MSLLNHVFGSRLGISTIILLAGFGVCSVQAEIVEIPLPGLIGTYAADGSLVADATFSFNMDPANIISASLRLSGTLNNGTWICDGPELVWHQIFGAYMTDETTGGWWWTLNSETFVSGLFSLTHEFSASLSVPATWGFLGDGTGEVQLDAQSAIGIISCPLLEWVEHPSAEVTEAVMIFDMSSTVALEGTSWGGLKSVYR